MAEKILLKCKNFIGVIDCLNQEESKSEVFKHKNFKKYPEAFIVEG